ncbi:rac GTPase-activating protein 1-like isoform X2 [Patiria miniata]|uniref:Rac GTPase-activating protein 1-like n=1 Tax=Patiria miniata TaxID=46514 RepID=A0A913ZD19_PATMI|nr:rac GTPase-activating protein 1-like isoform X2 [Patiria miniata]
MSGGSNRSIVAAFDEICHYQSVLSKGCEPEFLKFTKNQDSCRRQWLTASQERLRMQEFVTKITAENNGLNTKLKHARNQVDIELKKRKKAEGRSEELDQQIMLIRELLADNKMNELSEKDRESLAFLKSEQQQQNGGTPTCHRLSAVHERSADLLSPSDVSYDHTEDDLDVSYLRGGKSWKRAGGGSKKRPSAPPLEEDTPPKKAKTQYMTSPQNKVDTSVVTTTVTVPADGPITAATHVETIPRLEKSFSRPPGPKNRKRPSRELLKSGDHNVSDDSFWSAPENQHLKAALNAGNVGNRQREQPSKPAKPVRQHSFCTKTVLKPESCKPCGKRIKFGKYALKCKDCRIVCHPDCQDSAPLPCQPVTMTPTKSRPYGPNTQLADVAPTTSPMVPALVIQCIAEVERRGMSEEGLYRLSGSERSIKELKERAMLGKDLHLDRTPDINNVTGLLKDFLRNISEPLVTFKLHETFMRAANLPDPDDAITFTYQAISELPLPNRDTLAYIILHLQRVSESPVCKMGVVNLSRVFGPTIVGHAVPDPEPLRMLNDTKLQPAVVDRLISLPTDFWKAFVNVDTENAVSGDMNVIPNRHFGTPEAPSTDGSSRFGPVHTPQTQGKMGKKTPSSSSISKARSIFSKTPLTPRFGSKSENTVKKTSHFFASPTLR